MNNAMKTSKDNFLMTTLIATGLGMGILSAVLENQDTQAVMNSAGQLVQSVSTPTAMQPVLYREAAIIVTAPRIQTTA
ncbi:MAG: hypothetical protein IPP88_04930 [Betaproteobacteria bacterium]|nr:hypothetical protein [Betaproteobacteria bacterium]